MAQLQFKSTDTSLWEEKFGNGSSGSLTISSNTTDAPTKTTGSITSGSTSFSAGSATGFSVNDLVIIHQSRNGGNGAGNWMLNKITNISGTTFTLKYAAVVTFNTTCQIQKLPQYDAVTINNGVTLTGSSWDGSTGGIIAFLCNGTTTVSGAISLLGKGYRGDSFSGGAGGNSGRQGEGTSAAGGSQSISANGNGGGGGGAENVADHKNGGGGGGNSTAGGVGTSRTGATFGAGGTTFGSSDLTILTPGGSGGSGGTFSTLSTGGNGGGILLIISKNIIVGGSININGTNGTSSGGGLAGSGGGAGGSALIKTQVATLGSSITASGGAGGSSDGNNGGGGNGGLGRIHLDYLTSFTGTTSPSLDVTQDATLTGGGGSVAGGASFIFSLI